MRISTPKLTPLLRRAALLLPLLCLGLLAQAQVVLESVLGGSLSYQPGGANNQEIRFKVSNSFTLVKSRPRDVLPAVGDVFGGVVVDFGDGTSPALFPLTVTGVEGDLLAGEATGVHTYAAPGSYPASTTRCCLLPNLQNNAGQPFSVRTVVVAGSANSSPVAVVPPSVTLPAGQAAATYQLTATDPDGDPLTYSLATAADVGSSSFTNVPGLSVNSRTGLVSLNTTGISAPLGLVLYNPVIKVSDGKTSILVSQFLRVTASPTANAAPVFTAPTPPDGQRISTFRGSLINFMVRATDANAGDVVTLQATGLPAGATLTPTPPAGGNPAQATFAWTPAAGTEGLFTTTFTATDRQGAQTTTSVTFEVLGIDPPVFVAPTPADMQEFTLVAGQPVSFTVKASDVNTYRESVTLRLVGSLPPGATLTPTPPVAGNPVQTTFAWTPTSANVGSYPLIFEARDQTLGNLVYTSVRVTVTAPPACDPAATRPVANADQFTAPACGPLLITTNGLLANDTDPLGRPLRVVSVSPPSSGTLVTSPAGNFAFTPAPGFAGPATFTYQVRADDAALVSPATGHYYEFVAAPGICWTAARAAASARTYNGLRGYLATITSADEKRLLAGRNAGQYWFGAADKDVEGEWRWQDGPEAGQLFWRGAANGAALAYANWASGEPNDFKNQYRPAGEDYAAFYGESGYWNDLADCGGAAGYVIEYGGLEPCSPVLSATGTVTITVPPAVPAPVAVADQLKTATNQPLTITTAQLLANDTDPLSRPLRVGGVGAASSGRLVTNPDGTFTFTPAPNFVGTATFTYLTQLRQRNVLVSPVTGHYYEFIAGSGITWNAALVEAGTASYFGVRGYLAAINSAAENAFLAGRNPGQYWLSGTDRRVEGEWHWEGGAESEEPFWRGAADGTALAYANWASGEPNDFKNQYRPAGEDHAAFYGESGYWNDLAARSEVSGYIVEYGGGPGGCTPVLYATGTVTITVGSPVAAAQLVAASRKAAAVRAAAPAVAPEATLEAAPNPSDGQFRLRVSAATDGPAQLDMYDMQGRRVKAIFAGSLRAGEVRELAVSAPELAAGIYMVRLQSGQHVQSVRVAVQH